MWSLYDCVSKVSFFFFAHTSPTLSVMWAILNTFHARFWRLRSDWERSTHTGHKSLLYFNFSCMCSDGSAVEVSGLLIWGLKFHVPVAAKPLLLDPQTFSCCRDPIILLTLWPWLPANLEHEKKHILLNCIMTVWHTLFSIFPCPVAFWLIANMTSCVLASGESETWDCRWNLL